MGVRNKQRYPCDYFHFSVKQMEIGSKTKREKGRQEWQPRRAGECVGHHWGNDGDGDDDGEGGEDVMGLMGRM